MEATPASTPRTPLTAFEDWHPPPSFVSVGTDTTSSEMVVLPVDAPSSVGDNPQETELPFEPVQPTQQRLAMQASPQTSDFTSGQTITHDVPAPPPPARTVAVRGLTLTEGPTAGEEPRETVGEAPTGNGN